MEWSVTMRIFFFLIRCTLLNPLKDFGREARIGNTSGWQYLSSPHRKDSKWWSSIFIWFSPPTWGYNPIWPIFFKWVVQPPTSGKQCPYLEFRQPAQRVEVEKDGWGVLAETWAFVRGTQTCEDWKLIGGDRF